MIIQYYDTSSIHFTITITIIIVIIIITITITITSNTNITIAVTIIMPSLIAMSRVTCLSWRQAKVPDTRHQVGIKAASINP